MERKAKDDALGDPARVDRNMGNQQLWTGTWVEQAGVDTVSTAEAEQEAPQEAVKVNWASVCIGQQPPEVFI